jgi:CheY-like chemotaxis protein
MKENGIMAHILIVDDEAEIRLLLRMLLESAGHSVFEARDGRAALDILETKPFDLITLDLHMPRMKGFEFLSILQNQAFQPLVLIISVHSDQIPPALENEVHGRLNKPFHRQELITMVNSLVSLPLELPLSQPA